MFYGPVICFVINHKAMESKIKVLSVNSSAQRGPKVPVKEIEFTHEGVAGDVHAGPWNRQVSLFDWSHAERFFSLSGGRITDYGSFAENITMRGTEKLKVKVFDTFACGDVVLEVTQVGKPFHDQFKEPGNYVMPREGVFCRVQKGGLLSAGDELQYHEKVFKVLVVTLSDRAFKGVYEDRSGVLVADRSREYFNQVGWRCDVQRTVLSDDAQELKQLLSSSRQQYDVIFTTGGTGIGPRDITPEVVKPLLDKEIPGVMEMIRLKYGMVKPNALLSRSVAGVMGKSLIYTLPGSVRAVQEYCDEIFKTLQHLVFMQHGVDKHG